MIKFREIKFNRNFLSYDFVLKKEKENQIQGEGMRMKKKERKKEKERKTNKFGELIRVHHKLSTISPNEPILFEV